MTTHNLCSILDIPESFILFFLAFHDSAVNLLQIFPYLHVNNLFIPRLRYFVPLPALILDIKLILNNDTRINLEMQVENQHDWPDRSLCYLCRSYDQLYRGEEYKDTLRVLHISILDFTLFPKCPEFYATYKLANVKNHHIYNDKFQLNVLELNQIQLATDEDKAYGLDQWAALFKATTWKEVKDLAANNQVFDSIAQELYKSNVDEKTRDACQAREDFYLHERRAKAKLDSLTTANETLKQENAALLDENSTLREKLAALEALLAQKP